MGVRPSGLAGGCTPAAELPLPRSLRRDGVAVGTAFAHHYFTPNCATLCAAMSYLGEICSLGAAVTWALAVILFRRSGETVPPFALNLFRVGLSSLLLLATLAVVGLPLAAAAPLADYLLLVASGIVGIAVSDTFYHRCLNLAGAGVAAVVSCLYPPMTALLARLFLAEELSLLQLAGMVLVLAGVMVTTGAVLPAGASRRDLTVGALWGVAAMATLSVGVILARPVLEDASVLWATTVRQLAALAVMVPVALVARERQRIWGVFRPRRDWRFVVPGTICGSYLALILWLAGFKYTRAGVAAVLNETSTVLVMILAAVFLGEPFTRRRVAGAALAIAGIALVTFG